MKPLARLSEDLVEWGRKEPLIRAVLWYGSFARGQSGAQSDLDAAVVHATPASPEAIVRSCLDEFGDRVRFYSHVEGRPEAALWFDEGLVKLDLHLVAEPEALAWLADSPDVEPPRLVAAVDKDGVCANLVGRGAGAAPRDVTNLIIQETEKFLVGFDACSRAHARSDGYQFYFHYNLALHRCARLVELAHGHPVYLFLPKLLLPRLLSRSEQLRWRELRGTLYLPEATAAKRRLAATFLELFEEIAARVPLSRRGDSLRRFLDEVIARDLFFNVRDFAGAFEGAVRPALLFRCSSLTRWQDEPALRQWLVTNRVRTVIDFRHPAEMVDADDRYPDRLLEGIRYVPLPLSGPPRHDRTSRPEDAGDAYVHLFGAHVSNVVAALRVLADDETGVTVAHCHVGKDRTGWFCAALALLLGLPEGLVRRDYMLSGQGVVERAIVRFIDHVRAAGGAAAVLSSAGLTKAEQLRLRSRLLTREAAG